MKLTHTTDNRLSGLFIGSHGKGRVFFGQFLQADTQLIEIFLCLRFNCNTDYRCREIHSFENDRSIFCTQRITRANIFETYSCANIATVDRFFRILFIRVHLEQTGNTLFLTRTGIKHIRARYDFSRIHTEEAKTTYIRVGCNLESERTHRLIERRMTNDFLFGIIHIVSHYGRSIYRAG